MASGKTLHKCRRGRPSARTVIQLYIRSGGRCALCNEFVLENPRSWTIAKFGEVAHVIAGADGGPRADPSISREYRDSLPNLILLCPRDHKEVDEFEEKYPVELLRTVKQEHEDRVKLMGELLAKPKTVLVRCEANIGGQSVRFSAENFVWALEKHIPLDRDGIEIDFSKLSGSETAVALEEKSRELDEILRTRLSPSVRRPKAEHLSVFAIGPIPLLIRLGKSIGPAVDVAFYHRDRATQMWHWPKEGKPVNFKTVVHSAPHDAVGSVILVSVSGTVRPDEIPSALRSHAIYEVRPVEVEPDYHLLQHPDTVANFVREFSALKAQLRSKWGMKPVELLPAIPPAIAVAIGRQISPKVDPIMTIYDYRKAEGGFVKTIEA